jgi:DNA (cytosine-5)-methyltransferase 1
LVAGGDGFHTNSRKSGEVCSATQLSLYQGREDSIAAQFIDLVWHGHLSSSSPLSASANFSLIIAQQRLTMATQNGLPPHFMDYFSLTLGFSSKTVRDLRADENCFNERFSSPETLIGDEPQILADESDDDIVFLFDTQNFISLLDETVDLDSIEVETITLNLKNEDTVLSLGMTVELVDGTFLRILKIMEDLKTSKIYIQGKNFKRCTTLTGLFPYRLNEVFWVGGRIDVTFPVEKILRTRNLKITTRPFPELSCRRDFIMEIDPALGEVIKLLDTSGATKREVKERGALICRWIYYNEISPPQSILRHIQLIESDITTIFGSTPTSSNQNSPKKRKSPNPREAQNLVESPSKKLCAFRGLKIEIDGLTVDTTKSGSGNSAYTFGDAFCGAGGVLCGAKAAGLNIKFAFDHSEAAIQTYRLNCTNSAQIHCTSAFNFATLDANQLGCFIVDILHISPPCQPFSNAHTCAGRDDEANEAALFSVGMLIKKCRPRIVTLEQTFGLAQRFKPYLHALLQTFIDANYNIRWGVLNFRDYGCVQPRKRLIVFASM